MTQPALLPSDEFNAELLRNAHPADWQNPRATGPYNLVAIGGGAGGIISALGAAGLGGKAALIERRLLGGDCLNYGCVPSKALIRAARAAYECRHAEQFGVRGAADARVDFAAVMARLRRLRAEISHHDSAERFAKLGVDVFLGSARFTGPTTVEVGGQTLTFRRCVLATGGRPAEPDVPGLAEVGHLTNETVFSLTELPRRLVVVGGGPIGCELAQAFRRFGAEVTLLQRAARLLPREEPEASERIARRFAAEGIDARVGVVVSRAEVRPGGKRVWWREGDGPAAREHEVEADAVLVAAGRVPNVEGLGLEAANIRHTPRGVTVDDRLRTTNPRVFAAGDIAGGPQFTHAADAMARACLRNAFFFGRVRLSRLVIPRCCYTDPEVAHVGLTADEANRQGIALDTYREELSRVDRAVLDGETEGFVAARCRKGTGQVVGATIVAKHAGEMLGELALLMTKRLPLGALSDTIHAYPTQVEALKRIGDQYNRARLTPLVAKLLRWILTWRA